MLHQDIFQFHSFGTIIAAFLSFVLQLSKAAFLFLKTRFCESVITRPVHGPCLPYGIYTCILFVGNDSLLKVGAKASSNLTAAPLRKVAPFGVMDKHWFAL